MIQRRWKVERWKKLEPSGLPFLSVADNL